MDKTTPSLHGPALIPESPEYAIVFLHGFGSDGEDLISLAPEFHHRLPAEIAEKVAFFAPNGPEVTQTGFGYQWFGDNNWTFVNKPGIEEAKKRIERFLTRDVWEKFRIKPEKTILVGFSQGTMTTLFTVPRIKNKIAGIVGFSGRLMWEDDLLDMPHHQIPILLAHGEDDDVVNPQDTINAHEKLSKLGFDVEHYIIPNLTHGINEKSVEISVKFIKKLFE